MSLAQSTGFLEIKPKENTSDESLGGAAKLVVTAPVADLSISISHQDQGINHFKGIGTDEFGRFIYEYILDTKNSSGQNIATRNIEVSLPNDPNITTISLKLKKNTVFNYYVNIFDKGLACYKRDDDMSTTKGTFINGKCSFIFISAEELTVGAISDVKFEVVNDKPDNVQDNNIYTKIVFDYSEFADLDKLNAEYSELCAIAPALQTDEQANREMELEKLLNTMMERRSPVITLKTEGSNTLEIPVFLENKRTAYYTVLLMSSMSDLDKANEAFTNRKYKEALSYYNLAVTNAATDTQKGLAQNGVNTTMKCLEYLKEIRQREVLVKRFIDGKVELESSEIEKSYMDIIQKYEELLQLTGNSYYADRKAARENSLRRMPMAVNGYCTVLKNGMTQQTGEVTVYGISRGTKLPNHGVPDGAVELFHVNPNGKFSSQIRHGDYIYLLFVPDKGNSLTNQNGALDLRPFENPRRHAADVNVRMGNIKEGTTIH